MKNNKVYQNGLSDGLQLGLFRAYRIIKAEKKLHAYNSGAGRVLKTIEGALKRQAERGFPDVDNLVSGNSGSVEQHITEDGV